jgi:alkanesulfonate monooxygenase SsuD/methylene tetrahydromethanopterin reductase-like flavin-dependent oxidoreductase (luciferase family)
MDRPSRSVNSWDPWTRIAAIAAVSPTLDVAYIVEARDLGPPEIAAREAAAVSAISAGRLALGLSLPLAPYPAQEPNPAENLGIIDRWVEAIRGLRDDNATPPHTMVMSTREDVLQKALPIVDMWSAAYHDFGNEVQRVAPLLSRVDAISARVGRARGEVERGVTLSLDGSPSPNRQAPSPINRDHAVGALRTLVALGVDRVQLDIGDISIDQLESFGPILREVHLK